MLLGIYEKAINDKFSWEEKIDIAKSAGFNFIEFSIDESEKKLKRLDWTNEEINQLKKILIQKNFYFNSMALSGLRKFPLGSEDKAIRDKSIIITEKAIILAKKLGIRNIQLAGYDEYYHESNVNTRKYFIESCKIIARIAMQHSVMLSFEIMDTKFMGTISKCLEIIQEVDSPWLNIYPDIGNISQWTDDLENEFQKGKNRIIGIHFKDTKPNTFKNVEWGTGTVDFQRLMNILKKIEYTGPYLIEMWSQNQEDETIETNIKILKEAKSFFDKFYIGGN